MAEGQQRRSVEWPALLLNITSQEQACAVACFAVQHLLFAKGQFEQPIAVLRKRRAQEKQHERVSVEADRQAHLQRRKGPRKSFADRRRERRLDETLRDIDSLHERLLSAVHALSAHDVTSTSAIDDNVTLLLRLGQAPGGAFTKQQYAIRLVGILSLPRTASQADHGERKKQKSALSDVAAPRVVFGGKANSGASASLPSLSRLPAMERKLVRFLLSMSMSDDDEAGLGRALSAPLGPTRAQVFLLAPVRLEAPGWTPRHALKVDVDDLIAGVVEAHERRYQETQGASDPVQAAMQEQGADDGSAEDVDELVQALSPLKRRRATSPANGKSDEKRRSAIASGFTPLDASMFATPMRPSRRQQVPQTPSAGNIGAGVLSKNKTTQMDICPMSSTDAGMDAKRLERLRARHVLSPKSSAASSRPSGPLRSRPRNGVLSAGFVIGCESHHVHDVAHAEESKQWFTSNIVFRARR